VHSLVCTCVNPSQPCEILVDRVETHTTQTSQEAVCSTIMYSGTLTGHATGTCLQSRRKSTTLPAAWTDSGTACGSTRRSHTACTGSADSDAQPRNGGQQQQHRQQQAAGPTRRSILIGSAAGAGAAALPERAKARPASGTSESRLDSCIWCTFSQEASRVRTAA